MARGTRKAKAPAKPEPAPAAPRMDSEAIRKALSGMYWSAFNMALATDSPRAATGAMRGLAKLNHLHFEPDSRSAGVRVVEEMDDATLDSAIDALRSATGAAEGAAP